MCDGVAGGWAECEWKIDFLFLFVQRLYLISSGVWIFFSLSRFQSKPGVSEWRKVRLIEFPIFALWSATFTIRIKAVRAKLFGRFAGVE